MTRTEKIQAVLLRELNKQLDPVWDAPEFLMSLYASDGDFRQLVQFLDDKKAQLVEDYADFEDPTPWREFERELVRKFSPDYEGDDGHGNEFQWSFKYNTWTFRLTKWYDEKQDKVTYRLKEKQGNTYQDHYCRVSRTAPTNEYESELNRFLEHYVGHLVRERTQLTLELK